MAVVCMAMYGRCMAMAVLRVQHSVIKSVIN